MLPTPGVHFDGDYSIPVTVGAPEPDDLVETRSRLYHVKFHGLASVYAKLKENFSITGGAGTVYEGYAKVDTSPCRDLGGGLLEWVSTYAEKPANRWESEQFAYSYQFINDDTGELYELPLNVNSRVLYEYYFTAKPEDIPCEHTYRMVKVGSAIATIGTAPAVDAVQKLGEDQVVNRWKGNIHFRRSRYVPVIPSLTFA